MVFKLWLLNIYKYKKKIFNKKHIRSHEEIKKIFFIIFFFYLSILLKKYYKYSIITIFTVKFIH